MLTGRRLPADRGRRSAGPRSTLQREPAPPGRPGLEDERMSYTGQLQTFGRGDVAVAGGKAANLGELVRAGLPVPPGFVITTDCYRSFVEHNDLGALIIDLAR